MTNEIECDIIQKLSAEAASVSVPCKLNNVKTILTPWTINGLFKRKRKNSQRKFLSNYARSKLFKNLILGLKGFKIQFFESLILAQDERWRRA